MNLGLGLTFSSILKEVKLALFLPPSPNLFFSGLQDPSSLAAAVFHDFFPLLLNPQTPFQLIGFPLRVHGSPKDGWGLGGRGEVVLARGVD